MSHESLDGLLATGEEKPAVPPRLTTPRAALEVAAAPSAPSAPPVPPPRGEGKAPPSDVPVAAAALLPQQPAPSPQQPAPQHFGQPAPAPHGKEQALPVAAAAAPHAQPGMDRAGVPPVDPVRVLSSLSTEELGKIPALDMLQLSAYFASLGLPELPATVVRNGLNGSILHTLSAADVDRMDLHSLGEAKAFLMLCGRLATVDRSVMRREALTVRRLTFWGKILEWHAGPCSCLNTCAVRDERNPIEKTCDWCSCSPMVNVKLPESSITLYNDHLSIAAPLWVDGKVPKGFSDYNRAFVGANESAWKEVTDNIDFSNVQDVDVELLPVLGAYKKSCADCPRMLCCQSLRREPNQGAYYWVGCCEQCFGFNHIFSERPEGVLIIRLRVPDERGPMRRIGVAQGAKELSVQIMHHVEEAQVLKAGRMRVS